jgi:hypothetical protein
MLCVFETKDDTNTCKFCGRVIVSKEKVVAKCEARMDINEVTIPEQETPERKMSVYDLKEWLKDDTHLAKLPDELANKARQLRGGCGCKFTPWVTEHQEEIMGYQNSSYPFPSA